MTIAGSGAAITNGQFDGNAHPNVGAFLWDGNHDGVRTQLCTVSLIAPRVVVTASHCTEFADRFDSEVWVTFDPTDVEDNPTGVIHGHTVTNPLYDTKQLYHHDVSVIVLDQAVSATPVQIAPVGLLDRMKKDRSIYSTAFTNVGYGTHEQLVVPKVGPTFPWSGDREVLDLEVQRARPPVHPPEPEPRAGLGRNGVRRLRRADVRRHAARARTGLDCLYGRCRPLRNEHEHAPGHPGGARLPRAVSRAVAKGPGAGRQSRPRPSAVTIQA